MTRRFQPLDRGPTSWWKAMSSTFAKTAAANMDISQDLEWSLRHHLTAVRKLYVTGILDKKGQDPPQENGGKRVRSVSRPHSGLMPRETLWKNLQTVASLWSAQRIHGHSYDVTQVWVPSTLPLASPRSPGSSTLLARWKHA